MPQSLESIASVTVTFPAVGRYRPLAGYRFILLSNRGTFVWTTYQTAARLGVEAL